MRTTAVGKPWPVPERPWTMQQTWHDLLFAHWPVAPDVLDRLLPSGLHVDRWEGQAWVGVVPFFMSGVRWRWAPPVPTANRFAELNVRTYVTVGGKPGVWFFSLDAASWLAVEGARLGFHLPYYQAAMAVEPLGAGVHYESRRTDERGRPALFTARYGPVGPAAAPVPGTLAHWLAERYCLYAADRRGRLWRGEIDHHPWPLQPAAASITANTMAAAAGIALPKEPPLLHFAQRLDVHVWPLERVRL